MLRSSRLPAVVTAGAPVAGLATAIVIYLVAFLPAFDGHQHPIGSDYAEFLPRILSDNFWFRRNSWFSVPWFHAAFCGGMPNWGNPQAMPYSLPVTLLWWVDPVTSVRVTFAACAIAGATGMWMLLRRGFETSAAAALAGSVLFLFNGFFLCHLMVGHLPYHPVMFAPWIMWLMLRPCARPLQVLFDSLAGGVLFAVMVNGGMLTILPPVWLSCLAVGLVHCIRGGDTRRFLLRIFGVTLVGCALSASKLAATVAFMGQFRRDFYALTGFNGVGTTFLAAFRALFLRPHRIDASGYVHSPVALGMHEGDYGVSPIPLVLMLAGLLFAVGAVRSRIASARWLTAALAALCVLPIALNVSSDGLAHILKHIPVIRSASTLIRYFFIYIPLFVVLASLAVDRLPRSAWWAALSIMGAIAWSLTMDRGPYLAKNYDPLSVDQAWADVASGTAGIPMIERVDLKLYNGHPLSVIGADDALLTGGTQVFCEEPVFGYFYEGLPWKPLHAGATLDVTDGVLNIKNPACEIFPEENHCRPGDQFPVSRRDDAEAFLSWEPFPFERSVAQRVAEGVNIATLGATLVGLVLIAWAARRGLGQSGAS